MALRDKDMSATVGKDRQEQCQKRPVTVSKETYYCVQRDLLGKDRQERQVQHGWALGGVGTLPRDFRVGGGGEGGRELGMGGIKGGGKGGGGGTKVVYASFEEWKIRKGVSMETLVCLCPFFSLFPLLFCSAPPHVQTQHTHTHAHTHTQVLHMQAVHLHIHTHTHTHTQTQTHTHTQT